MRLQGAFGLVLLGLVLGCQARPNTEQMLTSSAGPERMRAILRLAKQHRSSNVGTLSKPIFFSQKWPIHP